MDIVEDFEEFKVNLKEKFLDYAEANQSLIKGIYQKQDLSSLDSNFVIGVVTILEPKAKKWIDFYNSHVYNSNSGYLNVIQFLGLPSNIQKELDKRAEEREKSQKNPPSSLLDDFRQQIKETEAET